MTKICTGVCRNEIHEAIGRRSTSLLQTALQHLPHSIDEPDDMGYTSLHLASSWPDGLSLLLSYGADMEQLDRFAMKPIEYSMLQSCPAAVQQLLRAGCSCKTYSSYGRDALQVAVLLFRISSEASSMSASANDYLEIVKIVAKELLTRQRHLRAKVDEFEPSMSPKQQTRNSITDQTGVSISNRDEATPQSPSLLSGICTVYHCPRLTVKVADEMWHAGFREVDSPDNQDRTPLMILTTHPLRDPDPKFNYSNLLLNLLFSEYLSSEYLDHIRMINHLELVFWLHKKGASLHRPHQPKLQCDHAIIENGTPKLERRAIHFVAAGFRTFFVQGTEPAWGRYYKVSDDKIFGEIFNRLRQPLADLSEGCDQFLHKIMLDTSSDGCLCACSETGCLPATYFLKRGEEKFRLFRFKSRRLSEAEEACLSQLKIGWLFANVPSKNFPRTVSKEVVRLMTFEKLGLRHTCCQCSFGKFATPEAGEADEIRDEDREGIELLESILPVLQEALGDNDIHEYLEGDWAAKMQKILAEREELADSKGMREVGVELQDDDSDLQDDDSDIEF